MRLGKTAAFAAALALGACALGPVPAWANDAVRVAGEIVKQGGVNPGDAVAGLRVLAGLRTLSAAERLTADVGLCQALNTGAFDLASVGHPPICPPKPDGDFDAEDLGTILAAAVRARYIAPILGYEAAYAGTVGGASSPVQFLGGVDQLPHAAFADLDGDGDRDLYVLDSGALREFRDDGAAPPDGLVFARLVPDANGDQIGDASLAFGDVDADLDLDLLTGTNNELRLRRNVGTTASPVFGAVENVGTTTGFGARVALGDLNGDGRLDVLAGHYGGGLDYFRNSGTAGSPAYTKEPLATLPNPGAFSSPTLVDLDNDADLDLFLLTATLAFYRNAGTPAVPNFVTEAAPFAVTGFAEHLAAGRADGDADFDFLAVGGSPPNFAYFENTGSENAPAFGAGATARPGGAIFDQAATTYPRFGNLLGTPAVDLVVGTEGIRVDVYPTLAFSAAPVFGAPTQLVDAEAAGDAIRDRPGLFDLDGDGDLDLLGARDTAEGPKIAVFENTSSGGTVEFRGRGFLKVGMADIVLDVRAGAYDPSFDSGDLDGDGDADLLASTNGAGAGIGYWILRNTGAASLTQRFAAPEAADVRGAFALFNSIRPTLLDMDYDGDPDVLYQQVGGGEAGLLVNVGSAASPLWVSGVSLRAPAGTPRFSSHGFAIWGDFGPDGDRDLLLGAVSGGLFLWTSRQAD